MELYVPYMIINGINRALFDRAVLPETPDVDWTQVKEMCKDQSVSTLFWIGAQKAGLAPHGEAFQYFCMTEAQDTFQYQYQLSQTKKVMDMLREEGIPYILLKGSRMRRYYPEPMWRTSCDVDILFRGDKAAEERIHEKMLSFRYKFTVDAGTTINYFALPVEFEMHRRLFDEAGEFGGLFDRVWDYAMPLEEGQPEYVLREEIFYVYMIAHMAKHFTRYGCGMRPLIDLYLYRQKLPEGFSLGEAKELLKKMGLLDFERRLLALTRSWFETGTLSQADKALTDYILGARIYGDGSTMQANSMKKGTNVMPQRRKNLVSYVFPPLKVMRRLYPRMLRCPALLPVAWACRWGKGLLPHHRKKAKKNLERYARVDEAYVARTMDMLEELGLNTVSR